MCQQKVLCASFFHLLLPLYAHRPFFFVSLNFGVGSHVKALIFFSRFTLVLLVVVHVSNMWFLFLFPFFFFFSFLM